MPLLPRLARFFDLDPIIIGLVLVLLAARLLAAVFRRRSPAARRPRHDGGLVEWLDAGLLAVSLWFLVVRPFLAQVVVVESGSMAPTLHGSPTPQIDGRNDCVLLNRYLYRLRPPRRGEIVVFRLDPANTLLEEGRVIKRVIAVAGDLIEIDPTGRVVLNQRRLDEPYAPHRCDRVLPPQRVPPGTIFVLGDERSASRDSSRFERSPFVSLKLLEGKAVAICFPPDRLRLLPR
jgi:signal peptidase I